MLSVVYRVYRRLFFFYYKWFPSRELRTADVALSKTPNPSAQGTYLRDIPPDK